ncbi:single-stranded DNA-binding protein [Corynebacterium uterequi]|uniref:Single-stranded DNA-binding protein n=1 Tax=Corynebacterium uterequi TaxID=1072256 RepID=A0A0G3HKR4_9CORY|nr:single-stranded DNA-binding protein [Corynebacterium uterequi]AKK11687.1 single stranded DNA-binding protein [Corynebacterium uterequi]
MANFPITIVGNLTKDPDVRDVPGGHTVGEIRIAASRSTRDESQPSGWREVDHLYVSGELWGQLALNAKASLSKGMCVIATGRLVTQEWEVDTEAPGDDKKRRSRTVLKVDRLGLDLSRHVASSRRTDSLSHQAEGVDLPDLPDPTHQRRVDPAPMNRDKQEEQSPTAPF